MSFSTEAKEEIKNNLNNAKHCILARKIYKDAYDGKINSINNRIYKRDCCKKEIIKIAFIKSGTITDPKKNYHLEISLFNEMLLNLITMLLMNYGYEPLMNVRKNKYIIYFKDSNIIADILALLGAGKATLFFLNVKAEKEFKAKINRQVNCETSNIHKTIKSSTNQINDIKLIDSSVGIGYLPDNLKSIAKLRIKYPTYSFERLGEKSKPTLTKSTVSYRLKKISKIANSIRNGENIG